MDKEELLKELDKINKLKWDNTDDIFKKLRKIALEIDADDLLERYVDYNKLDALTNEKYKIGGLPAIKTFLYKVNDFRHDIFYVDFYGDARNVNGAILGVLRTKLKVRIKEL